MSEYGTPHLVEPPLANDATGTASGFEDGASPPPPMTGEFPAGAPRGAAEGAAIQKTTIGTLDTETAEFINVNGDIVKNYFQPGELAGMRPFAATDAWSPDPLRQEEVTSVFVGDASVVARILRDLHERRILLITGQEGSGREFTALYAAIQTVRANGFAKGLNVFGPLDRQMAIDLRKVAADRANFGGRVTIFNHIFQDRNRTLQGFFSISSRAEWERLGETLRDNNASMIFTAEKSSVNRLRPDIADCIASHEIQPLTPELVEIGVERKLTWLEARGSDAKKLEELRCGRHEIVAGHKTLSKIAALIDRFLRSDESLSDFLKHSTNIDSWFLASLPRDVDAWCFALALVLAQPVRDAKPVPWLDFDRLRRKIAEKLKSEEELFRSRRKEDDVAEPTAAESLDDGLLLRLCEATVEKSSGRIGDAIRFVDERRAATLWRVLLRNNRRVLTALVAPLRTLAEQDRAAGRVSLRSLAAQTIGRLGELDPLRLVVPLIEHWSGSRGYRPLVGQLLQGVVSSDNDDYRDLAFEAVARLVAPADDGDDRQKPKDGVLTAITAFAQAGLYEPERAMERLGAIIDQLSPLGADPTRLATIIGPPAHENKKRTNGLVRFASRLPREFAVPFVAIEKAIVFLCTEGDLLRTIDSIRNWMSLGGTGTTTLVALLFFVDGIANDLETTLIAALQERKNGVRDFCSFLADLYAVIADPFLLPPTLQSELRERFAHVLTMWARDAVDEWSYRGTVEDLFVAFAAARGEVFRRDIYTLLGSEPFTSDEAMRAFAASVRLRMSDTAQKGQDHAAQLRP